MTLAADIDLNQHQHIVLDHMSWDFYEHLLDEIGNRHIRVTYHNGRIEIMSPLPKHERWGARIALLVETMCVEKNIPMVPGGSTTFRDKAQQIGLEPDECYYLKNCEIFRQIEGSFDPTIHPPPDLAIEVDITHKSIEKQPIYAALGIPELWRFDGNRLQILILGTDKAYHSRASSIAFPLLPTDQFEGFIKQFRTEIETTVVRAFLNWVRTLPA